MLSAVLDGLHCINSEERKQKTFFLPMIRLIFVIFQDNDKGPGKGHTDFDKDLDVQNHFQIQVPERLHPYSKYKFSIKALPSYKVKGRSRTRPEEIFLNVETKQGML